MNDEQGAAGSTDEIMARAYRALGRKIEAIRTALGKDQEAISTCTGLGRSTVSSIENGRQNVSLAQIRLLAAALNVPADVLIKGIFD